MKIFYKTRATATGGRSCHTALDNGSLALDLAMPGSGKTGADNERPQQVGRKRTQRKRMVHRVKAKAKQPAGYAAGTAAKEYSYQ